MYVVQQINQSNFRSVAIRKIEMTSFAVLPVQVKLKLREKRKFEKLDRDPGGSQEKEN